MYYIMRKSRETGFTLVEIVFAISILGAAIVFLISGTVLFDKINLNTVNRTLAMNAAKTMIENLQSMPYSTVFVNYNTIAADDPLGAGTAPGPHFAVNGLNPYKLDSDGFVGRVIFPVDANGNLKEDVADTRMGTPMDLNGDRIIDSNIHNSDYKILPLTIEIRWDESGQEKTLYLTATVGQ